MEKKVAEKEVATLERRVLEIVRDEKFVMLSTISRQCGISELAAARALPKEMRAFCGGDDFLPVWEAMTCWPRATFIMCHGGSVMEIAGALPPGKEADGWFNLAHGAALGGHIRHDAVTDICFLSLPFMGKESHSVQFFDAGGNVLFSVYVGREKHALIPEAVAAFRGMRKNFCKE